MRDLIQEMRNLREGGNPKLTADQKRILLILCNAAEANKTVKFVVDPKRKIRETTTAAALVKKGLAVKLKDGRYKATDEGYWLGDTLRIQDRQGKVPARKT